MAEELNKDTGKISGKSHNVVESSGKIAGSHTENDAVGKKDVDGQNQKKAITTRKERIASATEEKGLKSLTQNFGDSDGDWQIIESDNLFEVLFLDYNQIISINPEVVKNNFTLLEAFWKEKKNLWESESVRKTIEDKYGKKNLNNCIKKLEYANEQLFTIQKINEYYLKYREQRIRIGESKLEPLFNMMLKDGEAEPSEMENIFEEGLKLDLSDEEITSIIKKILDTKEYKPYENPSGNELKEQLLSVSWMTEEKLNKRKKEDKDKEREIFENKFAKSIEDIGEILFNDEAEARQYIKEGLLVNSIDYFSSAKAKQFLEITKTQKGEYLKYLQIVYRLNPKLPYRFSNKLASSTTELCLLFFENNESIKSGKEHFKQGNIEIWLQETHKDDYQRFIKIRDTAENVDLAFLEFLYSFNPKLPYRFAGKLLVKTPIELSTEIDKSKESWTAGREELFNSSILIWLKTIGKLTITKKWDKVKDQYLERKDVGLENFLHILNENLEYSLLEVNEKAFSIPSIQSGDNVVTSFILTNKTRGFIEGDLTFSKLLDGVTFGLFMADEVKPTRLNKAATDGLFMSDGPISIRLVKAATEFNVGVTTIVDFLHKKGFKIDSNPNTKLSPEMHTLLIKEYQPDKATKDDAMKIGLSYDKHEAIPMSSEKFFLNVAAGVSNHKVNLTIDSKNLLKGVDYKTDIQITTFDNKKINIPVSFRLVFPRNAFIKEIIKYSLLFALFGVIIRGVWSLFGFNDWLKVNYQYYLSQSDVYWQEKPEIFYFPLIFVILIIFIILISKNWKKVISAMDKI